MVVTGEPGIGKTALVEGFLTHIEDGQAPRIGRGQCVEQYGAGEPYLPVLEALGRLARAAGGERVVQTLLQHAPTWMAQLPGVLADDELDRARRRAASATRDRMLREIVEGLEALAVDAPLVLILKDLHWSDTATVDLLTMVARRREAARLLVLATYRPADVSARGHALRGAKQELQLHGDCVEIPLSFLDGAAVDQYLSLRCPGHAFPAHLARALHRSTDGNPLFLVNAVDDLISRGLLGEAGGRWRLAAPVETIALGVPETLRELVEKQVERLTADEEATLALASVAGVEFPAALVGAGASDAHDGERTCQALARRGQFLRIAGVTEWPDGTVAGRYAFIHALYQQVLHARLPAGHRAALHLRTGERLERGYGERADEIASELAVHFEEGRDLERAVRYRTRAGERALRQHAYREAADHATRALDLLRTLPESPERAQHELGVQLMLGSALTAIQGFGSADVAQPYERARELCARAGDTVQLLPVILGLGRFHMSRGELKMARGLGARLLAIAEATRDTAVGLGAHNALGLMAFYAGEFETALGHCDRGIAVYDRDAHGPDRAPAFRAGHDLGVSSAVYAAWTLQLLGHPARAAVRMREALGLARSLGHPFSVAYACQFAAGFHLCRGELDAVLALEDEALAHSTEHGFRLFPPIGAIHRGSCFPEPARGQEVLAQMRQGLATLRAMGIEFRRPAFLALLADACQRLERPGDGLTAVAEALAVAQHTGQHYWDAELFRLRGTLTLRSAGGGARAATEAESCFLRAIEIARRQAARWFELRAATELSRLWGSRGGVDKARGLLAAVYERFTEGFEVAALVQARTLLEELGARAPRSPANTTRPGRRA
jgi:predicted ATPase